MSETSTLTVQNANTPEGFSYPIIIDADIKTHITHFLAKNPDISKIAFIVDEALMTLWGQDFIHGLSEIITCPFMMHSLPSGEHAKSFAELEKTLSKCLDFGLDRQSLIIALGGGVVGDHAGFAASVLMRGIDFIQIPTTLLAMVDSSVGGKTGINMPQGKNLVGAFHQPKAVFINPEFLKTLSDRDYFSGYAETLKYSLINDAPMFDWLNQTIEQIKSRDIATLQSIIYKCCAHKVHIVAEDEREGGVRALLNLGHTFGHALESYNNYDPSLTHGEAVAIGMMLAFEYSEFVGLCPKSEVEQLSDHLKKMGLPTAHNEFKSLSNLSADQMLELMRKDKKTKNGRLRLILTKGIGQSFIAEDVYEDHLREFLKLKFKLT